MFSTVQKPQNFSLELIDEDNFHTKAKDTSTLTSLAESTSDKFLKKQTFYQRRNDYFYATSLTLTLDELTINGSEKLIIPINDILGASAKPQHKPKNNNPIPKGEEDLWCLNIYLLSRYRQSGIGVTEDAVYKRKYQKLKFVIWSSCLAVKWKNLILQATNNPDFSSLCKIYSFDDLPAFKRHFLVFISTKSGRAGAMKSWAKARKLLSQAGCDFTEVFTKYGGHAKDYMKECDPSLLKEVDGFLSVSGDGGLHEIVNGLLSRPDGESYFHLPFGVIPGGTNNCMDKNLLIKVRESVSIKTVCHFIAKGRTIKSDLTLLETENKEKIYNIGIFAWAAFATIDLESNKMRALGKTRFTLYGIWNVVNMRKYNGRFMYSMTDTELPDINTEINSPNWQIRSGPFANLSIHNLPWISTKHRACPSADFQDGLNHAFVFGGDQLSRVGLCKALASIKGKKLKQEAPTLSLGNEHYKMKTFRIEPADGKPSLYDIDGEAYKATKIQGKVLEKALTLFCPQY